MDSKYLALFKSIWNAPAGKQVIGILMIIPIAMVCFYHYYYSDIILENKELKFELKEERKDHDKTKALYLSSVQEFNKQILKVDSIHSAKFNTYRDRVEQEYSQTANKWEQQYHEAINDLVKTRKLNERTTRELTNIKD